MWCVRVFLVWKTESRRDADVLDTSSHVGPLIHPKPEHVRSEAAASSINKSEVRMIRFI